MVMRVSNRNSNERDLEAAEPLEIETLLPPIDSKPIVKPATGFWANPNSTRIIEFLISFVGLIVSYCTWGVMQELIMNTKFSPSPLVPSGMFPSCKHILIIHIQLQFINI